MMAWLVPLNFTPRALAIESVERSRLEELCVLNRKWECGDVVERLKKAAGLMGRSGQASTDGDGEYSGKAGHGGKKERGWGESQSLRTLVGSLKWGACLKGQRE